MSFASDDAPVPLVDRVLGAALTFLATSALGTFGAVIFATDLVAPTDADALLAGATVGVLATVLLVPADGYARILVPVEGRRWTVELGVAALALATANALVELAPALTVVWVALALAVAYYGTVYVGERVADAFEWYDRDAYAWRTPARSSASDDR
ncbi:hypothetical protein G9C85_09910 [Halorubellus sp. JP-L1]|uniref:hypothetical protein n=1 Tax=Halorubellus sp. JP-L1 TaxID=2715753 RepID=UPI00140A6D0B|nr:hypothetical protein [Halorubellus sp. JP-L1]NHN41941.1 hypothetical protein [Halorubellus sp. JP-L1]